MTFVSAFVLPTILCIVFVVVQYLAFLWVGPADSGADKMLTGDAVQSELHSVRQDTSKDMGGDEVMYDLCYVYVP